MLMCCNVMSYDVTESCDVMTLLCLFRPARPSRPSEPFRPSAGRSVRPTPNFVPLLLYAVMPMLSYGGYGGYAIRLL